MCEILFSKQYNLNSLKTDLDDFETIKKVSEKVKEACWHNLDAFLFLLVYLKSCIVNQAKKGGSI